MFSCLDRHTEQETAESIWEHCQPIFCHHVKRRSHAMPAVSPLPCLPAAGRYAPCASPTRARRALLNVHLFFAAHARRMRGYQ